MGWRAARHRNLGLFEQPFSIGEGNCPRCDAVAWIGGHFSNRTKFTNQDLVAASKPETSACRHVGVLLDGFAPSGDGYANKGDHGDHELCSNRFP